MAIWDFKTTLSLLQVGTARIKSAKEFGFILFWLSFLVGVLEAAWDLSARAQRRTEEVVTIFSEHEFGVRFSLPFRAILGKDFKKRRHKTILQSMVLMRQVVGVGGCPDGHSTKLCQSSVWTSASWTFKHRYGNLDEPDQYHHDCWHGRVFVGECFFHFETHSEDAIPAKSLEPPTANQTALATEVVVSFVLHSCHSEPISDWSWPTPVDWWGIS